MIQKIFRLLSIKSTRTSLQQIRATIFKISAKVVFPMVTHFGHQRRSALHIFIYDPRSCKILVRFGKHIWRVHVRRILKTMTW